MQHGVVVVVSDLEAQTRGVDVAVAPEEQGAEDGFGEEIQDAVEDGFAVGGNDVAGKLVLVKLIEGRGGKDVPALGKTPGNRVQDPQEGCETAAHEKGALDVAAKCLGVDPGFPCEHVDDVEEGDAALKIMLAPHNYNFFWKIGSWKKTNQRQNKATCKCCG